MNVRIRIKKFVYVLLWKVSKVIKYFSFQTKRSSFIFYAATLLKTICNNIHCNYFQIFVIEFVRY